jgi:hypothetical protein
MSSQMEAVNKGYAVDFVINVMKELSPSEPVLFQRDGSLYVASSEGFGQVTYGLRTSPEKIESWEKRKQPSEILESEDVIREREGDEDDKGSYFKKGEEPFLKAIAFGTDTQRFCLEEMTGVAKKLTKLSDDGKIRMISHGNCYRSHKYGYANDGTDVWVQEARVMDRERYLELVREREDGLIQAIELAGKSTDRGSMDESYRGLKLPDCVIITPYLKVSLPRSGRLHLHRSEADSWTSRTEMDLNYSGSTKGSILRHEDVNTYGESPFAVNLTLNAINLQEKNEEGFKSRGEDLVAVITKQLSAVTSSMPIAGKFIERMNAVHHEVCARNLSER